MDFASVTVIFAPLSKGKSINFCRIKQETEDFIFQPVGSAWEVFDIMEDITEVLEDCRFRRERPVAIGQFQEDVLDAVHHQFKELPFPDLISV